MLGCLSVCLSVCSSSRVFSWTRLAINLSIYLPRCFFLSVSLVCTHNHQCCHRILLFVKAYIICCQIDHRFVVIFIHNFAIYLQFTSNHYVKEFNKSPEKKRCCHANMKKNKFVRTKTHLKHDTKIELQRDLSDLQVC